MSPLLKAMTLTEMTRAIRRLPLRAAPQSSRIAFVANLVTVLAIVAPTVATCDEPELVDAVPTAASAGPERRDPGPAPDEDDRSARDFEYPPAAHPWARFAPGAWRRIKIETQAFDADEHSSAGSTTTQEDALAAGTPGRYALRSRATVVAMGQLIEGQWVEASYAVEIDCPGEVVHRFRLADGAFALSGETIPCERWRIEYDCGGKRMRDEVWFSPTRYPHLLKRIRAPLDASRSAPSQQEITELLAENLPHQVAGRTLSCASFRTTARGPKGKVVELSLSSSEVPGGRVASWATEWDADNRRTKSTITTTIDFGKQPSVRSGPAVAEPAPAPPTRRELRQFRRRAR